jgi:hypothetical protein
MSAGDSAAWPQFGLYTLLLVAVVLYTFLPPPWPDVSACRAALRGWATNRLCAPGLDTQCKGQRSGQHDSRDELASTLLTVLHSKL